MRNEPASSYSYSRQPFWQPEFAAETVFNRNRDVCINYFRWNGSGVLPCIPGNGQVGILIQGPDNPRAYCYGVLKEKKDIPLYGLQESFSIHFSPGTFTRILHVPTSEIPAEGVPLRDVLSAEQTGALYDSLSSPAPILSLLMLLNRWEEKADVHYSQSDSLVARAIASLIWEKKGRITAQELEYYTGYCERHLRDIVYAQVGLTPKQLCRHTRFQNALRTLGSESGLSLADTALDLGYSDQAHMSREFKEFLGLSPSGFIRSSLRENA